MALYLGSGEKLKINIKGGSYFVNFYSSTPIISGVTLLTSDGYILKDTNGLYLTAQEEE